MADILGVVALGGWVYFWFAYRDAEWWKRRARLWADRTDEIRTDYAATLDHLQALLDRTPASPHLPNPDLLKPQHSSDARKMGRDTATDLPGEERTPW